MKARWPIALYGGTAQTTLLSGCAGHLPLYVPVAIIYFSSQGGDSQCCFYKCRCRRCFYPVFIAFTVAGPAAGGGAAEGQCSAALGGRPPRRRRRTEARSLPGSCAGPAAAGPNAAGQHACLLLRLPRHLCSNHHRRHRHTSNPGTVTIIRLNVMLLMLMMLFYIARTCGRLYRHPSWNNRDD